MTREVDQVINQLEEFVERAVRNLATNTTNTVARATPRDTGYASANWIPRVGSDDTRAPALARSTQSAASIRVQQTTAVANLTAYRLARGMIFIPNNVRYIVELNEGSSTQAPSAFVQTAIARAVNQTRRELR